MSKSEPKSISVYCASSTPIDPTYASAAAKLGKAIAESSYRLIYGGGSVGLMGIIAENAHNHGGIVHGVITQRLVDLEQARHTCDELEIVETMRQRKKRMEDLADAYIALPGGLGTYEELFEMLVGRILGEHNKPVIIINTANYFNELLNMFQKGVSLGFIKQAAIDILNIVNEPEEAIKIIDASIDKGLPQVDPNLVIPSR